MTKIRPTKHAKAMRKADSKRKPRAKVSVLWDPVRQEPVQPLKGYIDRSIAELIEAHYPKRTVAKKAKRTRSRRMRPRREVQEP